jgi:hypothetical protein
VEGYGQSMGLAVARYLHTKFNIVMFACLDDWWMFSVQYPGVPKIIEVIRDLGFTINLDKSVTQPTCKLVYLGLIINSVNCTMVLTRACLQHLQGLVSIVPQASYQDLQRTVGYISQLCYAMGWPAFLATLINY